MAKRTRTVVREDLGLPHAAPARQLSLLGDQVEELGEATIGRPPGSVNRNSLEMRRLREALGYRPGIVALAELGSGASLDELIARVNRIRQDTGCKADKALEIVFKAVVEYAAYDSAKIQPDRAAGAEPPGVVILVASAEQIRAVELQHGITIDGDFARVQNQGVSASQPPSSDTPSSDTKA